MDPTLASLVASYATDMPQFIDTKSYKPVGGHICGWDNGKGKKKQPRNNECVCGSGKKAKKCCVFYP